MALPPHPVEERTAGWWHLMLAGLYGFTLWYHGTAAYNHFLKAREEKTNG
jgi:hypothetical protein